jgi:hypothetical protein
MVATGDGRSTAADLAGRPATWRLGLQRRPSLAHRRCALETVEKVVTGQGPALDALDMVRACGSPIWPTLPVNPGIF